MRKSEFKIQAEKGEIITSYEARPALIFYAARSYRWENTADPSIDDLEYFLLQDEAFDHADKIDLLVGYEAQVLQIRVSYETFNESFDFREEFELEDIVGRCAGSSDYDDEVINTREYRGDSIEGAVVVAWNYEKYVGYARNFEGLHYGGSGEFEADLITGNENRTFSTNYSVLLTADEIEGMDDEEILAAVEQELSSSTWKWNFFKNNPSTEKIIFDLGLSISND